VACREHRSRQRHPSGREVQEVGGGKAHVGHAGTGGCHPIGKCGGERRGRRSAVATKEDSIASSPRDEGAPNTKGCIFIELVGIDAANVVRLEDQSEVGRHSGDSRRRSVHNLRHTRTTHVSRNVGLARTVRASLFRRNDLENVVETNHLTFALPASPLANATCRERRGRSADGELDAKCLFRSALRTKDLNGFVPCHRPAIFDPSGWKCP
jgi:hypothetical protein